MANENGLDVSEMMREVLGTDAGKLNLAPKPSAPAAKMAPGAPKLTPDVPTEEEQGAGSEEQGAEGAPAEEVPATEGAETAFTPDQQAAIDAQLAEARTAATTELQTKLAEAEAQIAAFAATEDQAPFSLPPEVDPLLFAVSPEPIDDFHQQYLNAERWAAKHADGYNASSPGWKEGDAEWTGPQVRERFTQLKQRHDEVVPAARARLDTMMKALPEAKEKFPNLFKQNHPDQIESRRLLRAYPSLLVNPKVMLDIGDLLAGRRTRLAKEAAEKQTAKPGATAPAKPAAAKPTAKPPLPGGGQSAHTPRGQKPATGSLSSGNAVQDFIKSRGSGADVDKLLASTFGRG